ncbi:MAG: RHS repeat-associated core domain-containing protein [Candidatus Obscuribacterales bacterium]
MSKTKSNARSGSRRSKKQAFPPRGNAPGYSPVQGKAYAMSPRDARVIIEGRQMPAKVYRPGSTSSAGSTSSTRALAASISINPSVFSIASLADALENDVDKIYQYVKNYIDFTPTFGSQKGAWGCLVDRMGNAFDQAALMVELLTEAGYTADFLYGELELSPAEIGDWIGTDPTNVWASYNMLANGGIPVNVIWDSGAFVYRLYMSHVWVRVDIGGTNYVFDPAYKTYDVTAAIDLETALGYNATSFESSCLSGSTVTSDYVQDINTANLQTELEDMADNLRTWIQTNDPDATVNDIIGGRTIVPETGTIRDTSLSYENGSVTPTVWSSIPSTYKTTMRVQYDTIDETFYSEDLSGKRLTLFFNGSNQAELRLEGSLVATSSAQTPGTYNSALITIDHPYAGWWGDQSFWQQVWAGKYYLIANSWGSTSPEMGYHHQKLLNDNIAAGGSDTDEDVLGESLSVIWHQWMAQTSILAGIVGRINECATVFHHQVGMVGHNQTPFTDLGGIIWSSSPLDNDYGRIYATDTMLGLRTIAMESNVMSQLPNIEGVSSDTVLNTANSAGQKIYIADSSNWTSNVRPYLTNYTTQTLDNIESWYINNGWKVMIHEDGETLQNDYEGYGYYAISPYSSAVGVINGTLLGGAGSEAQSPGETNEQVKKNMVKKDPIHNVEVDYIVDQHSGTFRYRHTDISIGAGAFPYSLPFTRTFETSRRREFSEVGYGWRHNYMITAHEETNPYAGLGQETAEAAAGTLAYTLVAIKQLGSSGTGGMGFILTSLGSIYASHKLTQNIVKIKDGEKTYAFTKLSDGTYMPPKGTNVGLSLVGSLPPFGHYVMETFDGVVYTFNTDNYIGTIEYPEGVTLTFTYNGTYKTLETVSNSVGRTISFSYDRVSLLSHLTSVSCGGASTSYTVDVGDGWKLKEFEDAAGQTTTYTYDTKDRITEYEMPNTGTVTNTYDDDDRVITQTDPVSQVTTFKYTGETTLALRGARQIFHVWNKDGQALESWDGNDITYHTYDGLGRETKTRFPEGNSVEVTYDGYNRITQRDINPKPSSPESTLTETFTYAFTSKNRWATHTNPRGNTFSRTYNSAGQVLTETGPVVGGGTPVKTWTYNGYGQMTSFTDETGVVTSYTYGGTGNELLSQTIDPGTLAISASFTYDARGDMLTLTNPRSYVTTFAYDALRRLTTQTEASPFGYQTQHTYDEVGNELTTKHQFGLTWQTTTRTFSLSNKVKTITDPLSKLTTNNYDSFDRLSSTVDAESRTTQFQYDSTNRITAVIDANSVTAEQRSYTDNGLVASLTDANSNVTSFTYDGHDRKKQVTYPDSSYEAWTYDDNGNILTYRTRSGDSITYTYDVLDRVATRTPASQPTISYTYDLAGRMLTASLPVVSGNPATGAFSRSYDTAGRLASETNPQSQSVSYSLDDNGNVITITYPDGYYIEKVYDALDRLTDIKLNGSGTSSASFAYDDLSRRTSLTYANGVVQTYSYDMLNRTGMGIAHNGGSASWTYGYNDVHQMNSQAFSDTDFQWRPAATATISYGSVNSLNQYPTVGGATLSYNDDGCLTGDGTWTYTYDADNMLLSADKTGVSVDFDYDAFHRQIRKTVGSAETKFVYCGDQVMAEYDNVGGTLINRYVYGFEADDPIMQIASGGTITYLHQDHADSVIATSDAAGDLIDKYKYSPWGESPSLSGTLWGFTGQRYDSETGLYHYKARYYDPTTGRFLQPDPVGYKDGLHLYAYVGNDPLDEADPSGTSKAKPLGIFQDGIDYLAQDRNNGVVRRDSLNYVADKVGGKAVAVMGRQVAVKVLSRVQSLKGFGENKFGHKFEEYALDRLKLAANTVKEKAQGLREVVFDSKGGLKGGAVNVEIKRSTKLSLNDQFRGQVGVSLEQGRKMVLIVSDRLEKISQPLINAVKSTGGNVAQLNRKTGAIRIINKRSDL